MMNQDNGGDYWIWTTKEETAKWMFVTERFARMLKRVEQMWEIPLWALVTLPANLVICWIYSPTPRVWTTEQHAEPVS